MLCDDSLKEKSTKLAGKSPDPSPELGQPCPYWN